MVGEFIGVAFISILVGVVIGAFSIWECFRCDYQFEKIYDGDGNKPFSHIVVHMCKKCGKRKITKV